MVFPLSRRTHPIGPGIELGMREPPDAITKTYRCWKKELDRTHGSSTRVSQASEPLADAI
ncbi:hypothetical protein PT974_07211 [Cladobotryum mycophilum]|uniref:Uncharacterized protein n=1 Tax=Cladobotryum mycophilum TaxID=491253 RepID=A0ABR0SNN0_9HYPO